MSYEMIPKVPVDTEERETVININPSTKLARIYSSDPTMIRKLIKLYEENKEVGLLLDDKYGTEIEVPAKWVKVSKPRQMNYTEEQKAALIERMRKGSEVKRCEAPV